jgi:dTDP-4-amino-4,6-dideoxygalactose transaminase
MSAASDMVPFNDLSRWAPRVWAAAQPGIHAAVTSGWVVLGEGVRGFERAFGAYLGGGPAVGVASGTDALELALRAVGVQRGTTVALAANAGFYTSTALAAIGAEPAYVDVADGHVTPGLDEVSETLDRTDCAAYVMTHLYGLVTPQADAIARRCAERGVACIEDCSQSHGARRGGVQSGAFGDIAAFSFYPTKNLGALGDGGAVFSRRAHLTERVRTLRQYGWREKYVVHESGGRNSRLDELQAIVLDAGLAELDRRNERRRLIVDHYHERVPSLRFHRSPGEDFVAHLCVVEVEDRPAVREALRTAGITTDVHFPVPDHLQPVWGGRDFGPLPRTERLAARVLSLPCFPEMTDDEVDRVARALEALGEH